MKSDQTTTSNSEVVYAIGAEGSSVVKIGRSKNAEARLFEIQLMSPVVLAVRWQEAGGFKLETALHRTFSQFRIHGEWFDFGDLEPIEEISKAVRDGSVWDAKTSALRRRMSQTKGRRQRNRTVLVSPGTAAKVEEARLQAMSELGRAITKKEFNDALFKVAAKKTEQVAARLLAVQGGI